MLNLNEVTEKALELIEVNNNVNPFDTDDFEECSVVATPESGTSNVYEYVSRIVQSSTSLDIINRLLMLERGDVIFGETIGSALCATDRELVLAIAQTYKAAKSRGLI